MPCVVKIIAWADGRKSRVSGWYIKSVDVQAAPISDMWLVPTEDLDEAKRWPDVAAVHRTYREVLQSDPVRPDGKPNRPLTALTIEILPVLDMDDDRLLREKKR